MTVAVLVALPPPGFVHVSVYTLVMVKAGVVSAPESARGPPQLPELTQLVALELDQLSKV